MKTHKLIHTMLVLLFCFLCIALFPVTPFASEYEVEEEPEREDLTEDEMICRATHIVTAELVSTGDQYLFRVQKTLKANSEIGDEIYVQPYPDQVRMVARTIGRSYLLFLERNSAVFYEHDIFVMLKDAEPADPEERVTELMERIEALAGEDKAPAYYGNGFTESSYMRDILAATYHIVKVKVLDEGVRSDETRAGMYPTVNCSCAVTEVMKGTLRKDDRIRITFFADDQVQTGKEYLVFLAECRESAPVYTLSSRNSVYDPERLAMGDLKMPEKADHDSMKSDDRISFTAEYSRYTPEDVSFMGILENHGDRTIGYSHAKLERMEDGEWYTIPVLPFILETDELPVLDGGKEAACEANALNYAYTMTPGKYRIVVFYSDLEEFPVSRDNGGFDHAAFAEFEVCEEPDPERPVFAELKEQSMDSAQALMDGCVVVEGGVVRNEDAADVFVRKALLGMPCELRIVYPEEGMTRHIAVCNKYWLGPAFVLETVVHDADDMFYEKRICSYIAGYDGKLVLTNFADPESASNLGFDLSQDIPVLPLGEETLQKLKEAAGNRYFENVTITKLFLDEEGRRYVNVMCMPGSGNDDEGGDQFMIGVESTNRGGMSLEDGYPEGLRPVFLSPVSDQIAAVHFVDEEGEPVTMFLDTSGEPLRLEPAEED